MARFADGMPLDMAIQHGEAVPREPQPVVVQGITPAVTTTQIVSNQTTQQTTPVPAAPVQEKSTCPGCKKKLTHLNYKRCVIESGTAATDNISKMIDFENEGEKNEVIVFMCPLCNMTLFADEDDVVDFLDNE